MGAKQLIRSMTKSAQYRVKVQIWPCEGVSYTRYNTSSS
jgi:hypothetical protein